MNKHSDLLNSYISSISTKFSHEETSEMGYRTDFEQLLGGIFEEIKFRRIDHDAKAEKGNKPDFVVYKGDVPILYIEAKDIGISLDKVEKSEQMARYFGYTNLVLTDYLEFRFYRNGISYGDPISIGSYDKGNRSVKPNSQNFENLGQTLLDFAQSHKEPIRSGSHLANIMGGKAQRIRDNVQYLLEKSSVKDPDLVKLFGAIKNMLVHDLTVHSFSDMYAQTMVYGLFVARYYDESPGSFSRIEARELIPNSNKFLKHFFDHIVGVDFKSSLRFIVDELCDVYSHADVPKLMEDYYKTTKEKSQNYDPVIHFYEDFLSKYDPELRKRMGAYYTPQPVVNFIVRSVDEILKKEFGLSGGVSDTTKLPNGKHKVQILDPATGTGTFIGTIIEKIHDSFELNGQKGRWPAYVHGELLPRIHGFELMMAPYTISHLRIGIYLKKTGFWDFHRRLGIYLTNTLENSQELQLPMGFGLAESIAEESREASVIKNETPIMVVLGNPPYSGISSNETKFANSLVERYKVEPGGKQKLQERKHWLNDDYVKFISFAESMVEKTGDGIVAMITNNGYLDNPTFRGMRWHLAQTFDKIYVLDLHGNAKKMETSDGKDQNVFNIMQGVGIILAIKTDKKETGELAEVYHSEIYGSREHKFSELKKKPAWTKLNIDSKMFYFIPKKTNGLDEYEKGIMVNDLFIQSVTGIVTARDNVVIDIKKDELIKRMERFSDPQYSDTEIRNWLFPNKKAGKYEAGDSRGWKLPSARKKVQVQNIDELIKEVEYRPFDRRYIYYDPSMVDWGRFSYMKHFIKRQNIGLDICRQVISSEFSHVFLTKYIVDDSYVSNKSRERGYVFPLYLYQDDGTRSPNLNQNVLNEFIKNVNVSFQPEDILDYIYAVLNSTTYRLTYREFLKVDFPRVPSPKNNEHFEKLVELGRELRELHLLESTKVNQFITTYPISGSDIVDKIEYRENCVFLNADQYFGNVPEIAWNFHIGGYQPAQKWLKDRKGKVLTNEDIEHYQKVIVSLFETDKLMKEIDKEIYLK